MSGETVESKVCSARGAENGPGTNSREEGSDGGGGW